MPIDKKPIELIHKDIEQIYRMLVSIKEDINIIKDYIKDQQRARWGW